MWVYVCLWCVCLCVFVMCVYVCVGVCGVCPVLYSRSLLIILYTVVCIC